jgi:hypothetical protein
MIASADAVNEYQTVFCGLQTAGSGSPGSVVASLKFTESVNGMLVMTVASAKLLFEGGAALDDTANNIENTNRPNAARRTLDRFIINPL